MRNRLTLLSGLVLVLAGSSFAATTLKPSVTPGLSYAFDNTTKMDLNLTLNIGGQQMNMPQTMTQVSTGTLEVLEAANGKISKAKITFAPNCASSMAAMGQQQEKPFPLAGKTVTAALTPTGVDIQPPDGVDADTQKSVLEMLKGEDGLYPTRPVNVGDEWTGALGSGEMKSDVKFKLDRVSTVNGREVAEITAGGTLSGVENGMNMAGNIKGPVVMDVQTGLITSAAIAGDMKIDGNVVENGQQIAITGNGTMSVAAKNTISGAGAVPNANGNMPPPINNFPLPTAALSGAYAGDGLTMNVTGDDIALELGVNKFTGKITQRNGANLAGNFSHQGTTFDFKCVVNGDNVDFTTGTKTYKLKKQGNPNPLG